jgi:hypothetical protein
MPHVGNPPLRRAILTEARGRGICTWYYVHGPEASIHFLLFAVPDLGYAQAADLGIHSKRQVIATSERTPCAVLGECYFHPNFALADVLYSSFAQTHDPQTIWEELERVYSVVCR